MRPEKYLRPQQRHRRYVGHTPSLVVLALRMGDLVMLALKPFGALDAVMLS